MQAPCLDRWMSWCVGGVIATVFLFDFFTPHGTSDWLLYFFPALRLFYQPGFRQPFIVAGICTALIVVGFLFRRPEFRQRIRCLIAPPAPCCFGLQPS